MRKITKQQEPREWTEHRSTPGARYESKPELRNSLLEEQGYICAYCMRRIPVADSNSNETMRIDHVLSRHNHPELQLRYTNMVACCPRAINGNFHCDKSKGENDISFNLFDNSFFNTLSYSSKDGTIKSTSEEFNTQINNILNLNNALLKRNRLEVLKGVINILDRKGWSSSNIRQQIENWENKDNQGKYKAYSGIVIWFLNKHIIRCR